MGAFFTGYDAPIAGQADFTLQMPPWRETALVMLPELAEQVHESESPYDLWSGDIGPAFERAYDADPRDQSFIRRTYLYYDWCARAPRGEKAADDLLTCVCVCFLEHIPEHPAARADMPRWFPLEELLLSKEIFSYMIGEDGFTALEAHFRSHPNTFVPWSPADV